jgi:hypothetical protein
MDRNTRRRNFMTKVRLLAVVAAGAMTLALGLAALPPGPPPLNISGYEFQLGTPCTINSQPGKCGVEFGGWTGGSGQVDGGWTPFPGTRKGLWEASIDYTGSPDFDSHVDVQSGTFDVLFKNRKTISGTVTGGIVTWPDTATGDRGCGAGVATVELSLTTGGSGPTSFLGCLHDLPAGTVIPPKIWGTLE